MQFNLETLADKCNEQLFPAQCQFLWRGHRLMGQWVGGWVLSGVSLISGAPPPPYFNFLPTHPLFFQMAWPLDRQTIYRIIMHYGVIVRFIVEDGESYCGRKELWIFLIPKNTYCGYALESCHTKTCLKALVIVIPNEGCLWSCHACPPFCWSTRDYMYQHYTSVCACIYIQLFF